MDKQEATAVLEAFLARYRAQGREELLEHLDRIQTFEETGPSRITYQLQVQVIWDQEPGGRLRVLASIDDGGLRSFLPIAEHLLVHPDGTVEG